MRAILAFTIFLHGSLASAFELGTGIAAVEEGDDRHRPASHIHAAWTPEVATRLYSYGRTMGPFTERAFVLNTHYRFPIFKSNSIIGGLGGSALYEQITYEPESDDEESDSSDHFNVGAHLGITYQVPMDVLYMALHWDSHLFLAGSAGILLVTGRKQFLGLSMGINL